jgi:hypothetical protein
MKMGTTPSPFPYDVATRHALQSAKSATARDFALRDIATIFSIGTNVMNE